MDASAPAITLRDPLDADYPVLFEHLRDPQAAHMAAFGTRDADAAALAARWKAGFLQPPNLVKVIVLDGAAAGFVATFQREGKPQVAYWVARAWWGRGVASAALARLLELVPARPMYASAAGDNAASIRVLTKNGFVVTHTERAFAEGRGGEIDEVFLTLA